RSNLSVRTRGAPPVTGATARRFVLYALYFASEPIRNEISFPSGLHDSCCPSAENPLVTFCGVAPARASTTYISLLGDRSGSFSWLLRKALRLPSGDHSAPLSSYSLLAVSASSFLVSRSNKNKCAREAAVIYPSMSCLKW